MFARAKKFAIRQILHISSSRSYEEPDKLFVVPDDIGIQQIIHGLGRGGGERGGGIWVPNQILKI
jgi:hypothetical protein